MERTGPDFRQVSGNRRKASKFRKRAASASLTSPGVRVAAGRQPPRRIRASVCGSALAVSRGAGDLDEVEPAQQGDAPALPLPAGEVDAPGELARQDGVPAGGEAGDQGAEGAASVTIAVLPFTIRGDQRFAYLGGEPTPGPRPRQPAPAQAGDTSIDPVDIQQVFDRGAMQADRSAASCIGRKRSGISAVIVRSDPSPSCRTVRRSVRSKE